MNQTDVTGVVPSAAGGTPPAAGTTVSISGCAFRYSLTGASALTGVDPQLGQQWHLTNTGQAGGTAGEDVRVAGAWTVTKGAGARVAVVDDAIETVHPDLAPNVVPGASFNYRSSTQRDYPLPCTTDEAHGTSVAGLLAARDGNGIGIAGVAPRASLVGFNALYASTDADIADSLSRDMAVTVLYNNSWGSPDDGRLHAPSSTFRAAIDNGLANGRGGRGAVYVFPGGNGGCMNGSLLQNETCTGYDDNANYDGYVNGLGLIVACATTDRGTRPWYGEPGANLLVCGPSSNLSGNVVTTAIQGRYRTDFSGTSASTPIVAGVATLMLAANPALTWRDVRLILAETARKNDPTHAGWSDRFGLHFNHLYGFGVVDAAAAVARAGTWTSVGGSSALQSCGPFVRAPNRAIPDRTSGAADETIQPGTVTPVSDSVTIPASCPISKIEFVEVRLTAPHEFSGDLRVNLTSPNGLVSELAKARVCNATRGRCGDYDNWAFGSNRHINEAAAGTWTLELADLSARDTGTWTNWSVTVWGR